MCWNGQGTTTVHHESHSGNMKYDNMNVGEVLKIHVDMDDEVVNIDVNGDEGKWVAYNYYGFWSYCLDGKGH